MALICLNLQRGYISRDNELFAPEAPRALINAQACLRWARGAGLAVVHVHTLDRFDERARGAPIDGYEPLPSEPLLFKRGASLFTSDECGYVGLADLAGALVLGFSGAFDCLATAVDAERLGARLVFVADAIASPRRDLRAGDEAMAGLGDILANFAAVTTTNQVLARAFLST